MDELLDHAPCGFLSFTNEGKINLINTTLLKILGYETKILTGQHINIILSDGSRLYFQTHFFPILKLQGKADEIYLSLRSKEGHDVPVLINAKQQVRCGQSVYDWIIVVIYQRNKYEDQILSLKKAAEDATLLKNQYNSSLQAALEEKELLLKEVYHRVKNNLQVVSSLINLQSRNVKNEEAQDLLQQSADRIKAMALLHEQLYQSKDLTKINFNNYVGSLVDYLLFGFGIRSDRIKITMRIDDVFLDLDTAIPCGLIINELISNAFKHAFPDDRTGEINIDFTQNQEAFLLVIKDNGVGFPIDKDFMNSRSLGLQLVSTLTNQLMGSISLDRDTGSVFTLRFRQHPQ